MIFWKFLQPFKPSFWESVFFFILNWVISKIEANLSALHQNIITAKFLIVCEGGGILTPHKQGEKIFGCRNSFILFYTYFTFSVHIILIKWQKTFVNYFFASCRVLLKSFQFFWDILSHLLFVFWVGSKVCWFVDEYYHLAEVKLSLAFYLHDEL